uniref:Sec-independent protein translocase protein TatC n=1 Tax=Candidatus Kentrum sp. FW TaxID=2126338 RepID=A0A450SAX6_9GAMM|nr:MAG: Sec-independent protein translocase TatC [Candidatus Kentron sp. FW]VFJ56154.1 MAG: Sec-independent protein translocase TatC [Candidatus Kentron sp. FW]
MDSTGSPQGEMPFLSHLIELRNRLIRALLAVLVVLIGLIPFANDLYEWLSAPLLRYLPQGTSMIATEVASPFFAPFKLAIVAAIFITMPIIVYQLWAFVAPGLYKKEKKLVYPLMITSTMLFYLGAAFAYFAVFPLVFGFFTSVAPEGVEVATDISKYLDFVLKLFFAFGLAFEVPVATILLVSGGFTTPKALASKRPYVIVVAFIIGMLLTPPDVISQTLLALPMWILFELGIFFSRVYTVGKSSDEPSEEAEVEEEYRYRTVTEEELDRAMGEGLDEALGDVDPGDAKTKEKP